MQLISHHFWSNEGSQLERRQTGAEENQTTLGTYTCKKTTCGAVHHSPCLKTKGSMCPGFDTSPELECYVHDCYVLEGCWLRHVFRSLCLLSLGTKYSRSESADILYNFWLILISRVSDFQLSCTMLWKLYVVSWGLILEPGTKSESRADLNLPFSGAGFAVFRRDGKASSWFRIRTWPTWFQTGSWTAEDR